MSLIIFIFTLCFLVIIHELGHFGVARLLNVAIETFSVGFGPSICSVYSHKKHTEFRLSPLLLGGYVRFAEKADEHPGQRLLLDLDAWEQILILLAGPVANLLLAFVSMVALFKIGAYTPLPIIGEMRSPSYAQSLGLKTGQKILALDNIPVHSWGEIHNELQTKQNLMLIEVEDLTNHQRTQKRIKITPDLKQADKFYSTMGFKPWEPTLPAIIGSIESGSMAEKSGLKIGDKILAIKQYIIHDMTEFVEQVRSLPDAKFTIKVWRQHHVITLNAQAGSIIDHHLRIGYLGVGSLSYEHYPQWFFYTQATWTNAIDNAFHSIKAFLGIQLTAWLNLKNQFADISGPIGIARAAQEAWTVGFRTYLLFVIWLSIGLAVINLLPIPALDGGQCVMVLLRKFFPHFWTQQRQNSLMIWSFAFLAGLFVLGLFNDWSF